MSQQITIPDVTASAETHPERETVRVFRTALFSRRFWAGFIDFNLTVNVPTIVLNLFFDWSELFAVKIVLTLILFLYLGLGNSRLTGGRTWGKHLMQIAVINRHSQPLPVWLSLQRTFVLLAPYGLLSIFSGVTVSEPYRVAVAVFISALLLLATISFVATLYAYIFNRTGQSVHDLWVGSYVVPWPHDPQMVAPTLRPRFWSDLIFIVIALVLLNVIGSLLWYWLS